MIKIGEHTFNTNADMRHHIFNILNNATIDEPIKDTDAKILKELFLCHPEAKEKMQNQQIKGMKVGIHPKAKARAFCIIRNDGTQETFSINTCIAEWTKKNKQKNQKQKKTDTKTTKQNETQNIINTLNTIITLYNQLGKEIQKLKKALTDATK